MAVMRAVGHGRKPARHAHVREDSAEYVVEFDVADFTERELKVEALGPVVTVRGEQRETLADVGRAFRLRERLEETFRLPGDAAADELKVCYRHGVLEIHAPRKPFEVRDVPIENRDVPIERASPWQIHPESTPC
jgi:HSP20 family molecular chaperone IbpA